MVEWEWKPDTFCKMGGDGVMDQGGSGRRREYDVFRMYLQRELVSLLSWARRVR